MPCHITRGMVSLSDAHEDPNSNTRHPETNTLAIDKPIVALDHECTLSEYRIRVCTKHGSMKEYLN